MGRPWREELNGGIYHVIARGNNKEHIFRESIDKGYFIKVLKEYILGMDYKIYGYVLMNNHYHLVIQTFNKKLQEVMHQINNKYSKYFNLKYERVGHVFQGRYKAVLVQDERYLISLLRYVHQNPVKAGLCVAVKDYEWSSDIYYRKNIDSFISNEIILDMLSGNRKEAISLYCSYMEQEEENDYDNSKAIGEEAYKILCGTRKKVGQRKRLDEILSDTGINSEMFEIIKAGSRRRDLTAFKIKYAIVALSYKYTYREIATNINMTESSIRKLLERRNEKCQAPDIRTYSET